MKKPKESDAKAAKARGETVKKRKELNQSGLPIQEIEFTSEIASTASSSSLDTNLNELSCGTSCDGAEETDEIFEADTSTSTDYIEITVFYQANEKKQERLRSIAIIHDVNILDTVVLKFALTFFQPTYHVAGYSGGVFCNIKPFKP